MSFFSVPGSSLGYHTAFSRHVSLVSSPLWLFLSLLLFFMTQSVLRTTGWGFCRTSLSLYLSDISLMIRLGLLEILQRQNVCLVTSYWGYMLSTWLITSDANLDCLVKEVFARFLHFLYCIFGNQVIKSSPHSEGILPFLQWSSVLPAVLTSGEKVSLDGVKEATDYPTFL